MSEDTTKTDGSGARPQRRKEPPHREAKSHLHPNIAAPVNAVLADDVLSDGSSFVTLDRKAKSDSKS